MMTDLTEQRSPRVWWTRLNRQPFDPMFESRDEAVNFFGPAVTLMRLFEQPDACQV